MYHIKEDLRAVKSAEFLYEGLTRCMKNKDFDKISITDITKESTVSRATFYRNFDTVIDILYWKCDQLFKKVLTDYVTQEPKLDNPNNLINYVFHFWVEHVDVLEILIKERRIDIIFNTFLNNADIAMRYIYDKLNIPELNYKYFISTRVGIFIGVFQTWIEEGKKESADELVRIIEEQYRIIDITGFIF